MMKRNARVFGLHYLFGFFIKNAMWIMNKAVFAELRKAKDGAGNYYLAYGKGITSGFEWQFLGKPVYVSENTLELQQRAIFLFFMEILQVWQ